VSEILKPQKSSVLTVRVDDDLASRVRRRAQQQRVSQSDVVRMLLLELERDTERAAS
jgi:predicted transcriptional regulator